MAKNRKKTTRKFDKNSALWFIVTFLILLLVSLFLGYYFTNHKDNINNNNKHAKATVKHAINGTSKNNQPLNGTWVSKYDGAIMEINGSNFTLEIPSVSSGTLIHGILNIDGDKISIAYTSGSETCKNKKGRYIFNKKTSELIFKLIKDDCKSRADRMTAVWNPL